MTTQTNDTAKAKPAKGKPAKAPAKPAGKAKGAGHQASKTPSQRLMAKPAAKPAKPAKSAPRAAAKAKPAAERADGLRPGSKMAIAVDMVCRAKGATCPEIAKELGWTVLNSSTLKRFCEGAKVKLKEDDSEKPSRWFGTARA
jgi:hypothetical protein